MNNQAEKDAERLFTEMCTNDDHGRYKLACPGCVAAQLADKDELIEKLQDGLRVLGEQTRTQLAEQAKEIERLRNLEPFKELDERYAQIDELSAERDVARAALATQPASKLPQKPD